MKLRCYCQMTWMVSLMILDRNIPFWQSMPYNVRLVLADMCFNLGIKRLCRFTKMLEAMEERDFELAGEELLDSTYAVQVKETSR